MDYAYDLKSDFSEHKKEARNRAIYLFLMFYLFNIHFKSLIYLCAKDTIKRVTRQFRKSEK